LYWHHAVSGRPASLPSLAKRLRSYIISNKQTECQEFTWKWSFFSRKSNCAYAQLDLGQLFLLRSDLSQELLEELHYVKLGCLSRLSRPGFSEPGHCTTLHHTPGLKWPRGKLLRPVDPPWPKRYAPRPCSIGRPGCWPVDRSNFQPGSCIPLRAR
jgi:hypothetical protein